MRNKIDRGERSLENEDKKQKQNKFMFLSTEEKMKGKRKGDALFTPWGCFARLMFIRCRFCFVFV